MLTGPLPARRARRQAAGEHGGRPGVRRARAGPPKDAAAWTRGRRAGSRPTTRPPRFATATRARWARSTSCRPASTRAGRRPRGQGPGPRRRRPGADARGLARAHPAAPRRAQVAAAQPGVRGRDRQRLQRRDPARREAEPVPEARVAGAGGDRRAVRRRRERRSRTRSTCCGSASRRRSRSRCATSSPCTARAARPARAAGRGCPRSARAARRRRGAGAARPERSASRDYGIRRTWPTWRRDGSVDAGSASEIALTVDAEAVGDRAQGVAATPRGRSGSSPTGSASAGGRRRWRASVRPSERRRLVGRGVAVGRGVERGRRRAGRGRGVGCDAVAPGWACRPGSRRGPGRTA